jgi:hypothetical protein
MLRFQSSILRRWWDEEEESDDDDFFIVAAVLEGFKKKKRRKKFCGSLPSRHNVPRDILGGHDRIHIDYFQIGLYTMRSILKVGFGCRRLSSCG